MRFVPWFFKGTQKSRFSMFIGTAVFCKKNKKKLNNFLFDLILIGFIKPYQTNTLHTWKDIKYYTIEDKNTVKSRT